MSRYALPAEEKEWFEGHSVSVSVHAPRWQAPMLNGVFVALLALAMFMCAFGLLAEGAWKWWKR